MSADNTDQVLDEPIHRKCQACGDDLWFWQTAAVTETCQPCRIKQLEAEVEKWRQRHSKCVDYFDEAVANIDKCTCGAFDA